MDRRQLLWLFFGISGRLSRAPYFLAGLFAQLVPAFVLYRFTLVAETSGTSEVLATIFWLALILSVWSNMTLGIKRLHDLGQPGIVAISLLVPVVSYFVFIFLCVYPGNAGPNRFGAYTNSPR
ncbi:MAG: DUF805 domain-containing protein [Hyphomicrobiales bacterium]|nr:DUF805 domain-containing protein [Hyphomicrobiales bacterium]